jgi:hypothetical protein
MINTAEVNLSKLNFAGLRLSGAFLKIDKTAPGVLKIGEVDYEKAKIKDISAKAMLANRILSFDELSASFAKGRFLGKLQVELAPDLACQLNFKVKGFDLDSMVNDFDLKSKMQLSGLLDGTFNMTLKAGRILALNGDFASDDTGGTIIIKDQKFIKAIADYAHQPVEVIADSLQDYHYLDGKLKAYFKKNDILLEVLCFGAQGKREFEVVLHDVKLRP